tara:strand:+ start:502 stop:801 length:300 start_codon:yes stop_codon:yes gene_type:complete
LGCAPFPNGVFGASCEDKETQTETDIVEWWQQRGFGKFWKGVTYNQNAEVAQLVVQDFENFSLLHREREEVPGESNAPYAESVAQLEAHCLWKQAHRRT